MRNEILIEQQNGVLRLTINRPEKKNALTDAMYARLDEGFQQAAQDDTVRAVLIQGSGSDFTGGNDLKDFVKWGQAEDIHQIPVIRLMASIINLEKPLVAAVQGVAVGFGTTMLFHCDMVFAAESATFSLPFSKLAVVPEFGCSYLFPRAAGRTRATHMMMLGEPFGAQAAYDMGIVSHICSDDALAAQAEATCQKLVQLPARSLRQIKQMVTPPEERATLLKVIAAETEAFAAGLQSPEHREAITAFFEKRAPNFSQFD